MVSGLALDCCVVVSDSGCCSDLLRTDDTGHRYLERPGRDRQSRRIGLADGPRGHLKSKSTPDVLKRLWGHVAVYLTVLGNAGVPEVMHGPIGSHEENTPVPPANPVRAKAN